MNRQQKVTALLAQRADDERRLALDELDRVARATSTFGSKEHRQGRDQAEKAHDDARRRYEALLEPELDQELARSSG
jgi:hypothetical protein